MGAPICRVLAVSDILAIPPGEKVRMAVQGWMPSQCDKPSPKAATSSIKTLHRAGHVARSSIQEGGTEACSQGDDDEQRVRAHHQFGPAQQMVAPANPVASAAQ